VRFSRPAPHKIANKWQQQRSVLKLSTQAQHRTHAIQTRLSTLGSEWPRAASTCNAWFYHKSAILAGRTETTPKNIGPARAPRPPTPSHLDRMGQGDSVKSKAPGRFVQPKLARRRARKQKSRRNYKIVERFARRRGRDRQHELSANKTGAEPTEVRSQPTPQTIGGTSRWHLANFQLTHVRTRLIFPFAETCC